MQKNIRNLEVRADRTDATLKDIAGQMNQQAAAIRMEFEESINSAKIDSRAHTDSAVEALATQIYAQIKVTDTRHDKLATEVENTRVNTNQLIGRHQQLIHEMDDKIGTQALATAREFEETRKILRDSIEEIDTRSHQRTAELKVSV